MKLKALPYCFVAVLLCTQLNAQKFTIKQKSIGRAEVLERIEIKKTVDGGLVMCNVKFYTCSFCTNDYWMIKFDSLGRKQKELTVGGSGNDQGYSITPTQDHGYLVAGISNSGISGDKTEPVIGGYDFWIVKLDSLGHKQWDKTLGTPYNDLGMVSIDTTLNGGYVLGGSANGGMWIAKLDDTGKIQWDRTVTGAVDLFLEKVYHTTDGGFIVGGNGSSTYSGSFNANYMVAKLDARGNIVWQKQLSGKGFEDYDDGLYDIIETPDGGYLAGGSSSSGVGVDKTDPNTARQNIWIVKLDANGNKLWDKTLGGEAGEDLCSLTNTTDGGFIVATTSSSGVAGEKTEPSRGSADYWIVKLNSQGKVQWDKTIGGSAEDDCSEVIEYRKNEFVLGGTSASGISGDRTVSQKGLHQDLWIIGLKYQPGTDSLITDNRFAAKNKIAIADKEFKVYPNPLKDIIHIQATGNNNYIITNASGKVVLSKTINNSGTINVSQLPAGVYYLQNITRHTSTKIIVTH